MKYIWKIGLTVAVIGLSGALLLSQVSVLSVVESAQAQEAAEKAEPASMKSAPPDVTSYTRPIVNEDFAPGGVAALGVDTQGEDASVTLLGGGEPGIFIVDVVVNNTDPNLTNTDTASDGETSIAVNPEDPNEIVIAAFSGGFNPNAPIYHSLDGGLTWTREDTVPGPPGWPGGCPCDWTWDYGRDGELGATILAPSPTVNDGDPTTFEGDIVSLITTDPTSTGAFLYLGNPAQETNNNNVGSLGNSDQPWLLINPDPATPAQDNVYVAYDDFSGAPDMRVAVSYGNDPPNFTVDVKIGEGGGGGTNPGLRLAKDPRTGIMWALWSEFFGAGDGDSKDMDFLLNRSTDGGATWPLGGGSGILVTFADSTQATPKFGTVNALLGGVHHAAVDPTTGVLYYVFGNRDAGTGKDRLSIKKISSDGGGGLVFGTEHFVTGQVEAAIPQVAVLDNGVVGVFYYTFDGFSSDDFPIFTAHLALSEDEGVSFDDHELVTFLSAAKDSCPNDMPGEKCERQRVLGDYMQMQAVGNCFYGSFTANGAPFGRPMANHDPIFFKTCIGPQLQVPSDLSFGDICQGGDATETLNVCNTGTETLVVESITPSDEQFTVATPSNGFPVSISSDFCFPFQVTFTPVEDGVSDAEAVIVSNDPNSPTMIGLSGNAPLASISTFIADDGDFGNVCTDDLYDLNLTIQSNGICDLEIDSVSLSGADADDFELPVESFAGTVIEAGNSLLVPVRFAPDNFTDPNPRTASIDVESRTLNGEVLALDQTPIKGTVPPPDINLAIANEGDFGNVCKEDFADLDLTLFNQGMCDLEISNIELVPPGGSFSLPSDLKLPLILSPDADFNLPVRYAPDMCDDDPENAQIKITSDDPDEMMKFVGISGTSPCPNLVIDPAGLTGDFAFPATVMDLDQSLGCFSERTTTVRNTGECPLTIDSISAANDFTVMTPSIFPIVLPPGEETLEVTVRFTPLSAGNPLAPDEFLGLLSIVSDDPDAAGEAQLCGEGVAQSGIRVLVTEISSGFPLPVEGVDNITIRSKGKRTARPINLQFTDVAVQTADICENTVAWHVDQETLPAVGTEGSNPKSSYLASAKEGSLADSQTFTLGQCDFYEFQLQLLDSNSPACALLPKGAACTDAGQCCSGKCKGPAGGKSCK